MNIIEFYKKVVNSLKLLVSRDEFIQADVGGTPMTITVSGKPLVLPTKDHIDTALDTDDDGNVVVTKVLYNPLNEDTIKGDSLSLKQTKNTIEKRLSYSFAGLGELLLMLAADPKLQNKTSMDINKFLISLSGSSKDAKEQVDPKSIELWSKIYQKSLELDPSKSFIKTYLKQTGMDDNVKYNRMMVIGFPFYDQLLTADRDTSFFGVTLRKKDIGVFKRIYEFIFSDMKANGTLVFGSQDKESPGFISAMTAYIKLGNRFNRLAGKIKFVDEETYDSIKIPIKISLKDLDNLSIYHNELLTIPTDIDMNRKKASVIRNNDAVNDQLAHSNYKLPTAPQQSNVQQPQMYQQQQPQQQQQLSELTGVDKILAAGNVPVSPVINPLQQQMQQPGYPQHTQPIQPVQSPPMGINTLLQQQQQPVYQQPVYQQPVYQQPMYQQPTYQQSNQMGYNTSGGYQQQQTQLPMGLPRQY